MPGAIDWGIILFVIGFVLVGIEMILPGLNGPGIAGAISLITAIFLTAESIKDGVIVTIIVLIILMIMLIIIVNVLSKGRLKSPIVLKDQQNKEYGYTSSKVLDHLVGMKGVAITDLRPSGTGEFQGIEYDIISDGKYIDKGSKLIVYKVEGLRVIVKAYD